MLFDLMMFGLFCLFGKSASLGTSQQHVTVGAAARIGVLYRSWLPLSYFSLRRLALHKDHHHHLLFIP